MRSAMIAIGAASLVLLPHTAFAQAAKAPAPAVKPADRDVFCFVATAFSATALRQNEAKLTEQDKKAAAGLNQAVPYYAGRVSTRLSGPALVKAFKTAEGEFKGSNRGVEALGCLNAFGATMKSMIEASRAAGAPAAK
ncbi:hypothetical protein SAMN06295912_12216 [Sphingomonas laterariae]|uniref:HdeA/HdeB family protein n=1 Tax=Edaphosphingomonas laterariae TaxID=861865 RepID=A0A239I7U0_9SPHN|nr:hypothetical protein [Sphingomonas laterariae]SNS89123.1 hypothetical protein SAMN06295912_12216 [Sphingomonas laterariae]